ncbi:serine/threonine-protein kinase [Kribbella sp. NPDC051952]|uniref:serine/threonine-protein kinase n=1 Tax=Kribbella sp. NPDC051952 TaxID=3154851 RepID=UPI003436046D
MEAFAGRYRLIDLIGTGGMGSVWRAWDLRRSAYVAAKVLGQHDAAALLRFVREQSLRIEHPHVVAPHGWAADDDKVVFAMELVRGGSAATLLGDHGPLPSSYVAVLLDQLLHGLSAVHAAGVVHRDVKPANLLLDATGTGRPHLRLSDFGVAGLVDEPRMTRNSTILGTPGYLAPEQLAGADPDSRQDLYAVGAVAVELLTGGRPGVSGGLPTVEGPLGEFIRRCTATDPSDRPESAKEAGRLLAETGVLPPDGTTPWAEAPDPPEVFDQLPPLPHTWTPTGPAIHPPTAPPQPTPAQSTPGQATSARATPAEPAPLQSGSPAAVPTPLSELNATLAPSDRLTSSSGSSTASGDRSSGSSDGLSGSSDGSARSADRATTSADRATGVADGSIRSSDGSAGLADGSTGSLVGASVVSGGASAVSGGGRGRRVLLFVVVGCFVGAAGLLGAAVWVLLRQ